MLSAVCYTIEDLKTLIFKDVGIYKISQVLAVPVPSDVLKEPHITVTYTHSFTLSELSDICKNLFGNAFDHIEINDDRILIFQQLAATPQPALQNLSINKDPSYA
jgi:hypothetical protein